MPKPPYYDPKQPGLPVYEMVINPDPNSDVEVSYVAFVDKPAIERNFLMFNSQKIYFALNEEKRIVSGPAMIADSLIYRKDDQGEYNVFFSADTIKQIALKFFKKDYHKNLNLFHDPTLSLDGVTIFESFVSDKTRGIQPMKGFEDLPDGTWFISAKVENEAVWNKIKSGEVRGFSVEGIFSYVKEERVQNGAINQNSHLVETSFMSEINDLWKAFKEKFLGPVVPPVAAPVVTPTTLGTDYTLKDGTAVSIDKLEVGGVVLVGGVPAAAGEYELQDGTKYTVADSGVIAAITPAAMPAMDGQVAAPVPTPTIPDYTPKFAAYDEALSKYETRFTEQASLIAKQDLMLKGLFEIIEKIAASPAGDPVDGNKNSFVSQKIKDKEESLKNLSDALSKLKKSA